MTEPDPLDELQTHIAHRADDLVRAGMSRDEAERQARVEFGSTERYREEAREARRPIAVRLDLLARDVRMAVRRLRAAPVFSTFAILSLAVGIGVTTSIHAVMASMLWRPMPVPDPERLVVVTRPSTSRLAWQSILSRADFDDLRAAGGAWRDAEAAAVFHQAMIDQPHGVSALVRGEAVTGGYFDEIGLRPAAGRLLHTADDHPAAPNAVVIGHRLWETAFGSDPAVLGRAVRLGGHPFVIVGVAPQAFNGLSPEIQLRADAWVPLSSTARFSSAAAAASAASRETRRLTVFVRLRPDDMVERLSAEAAVVGRQLDAAFPLTERAPGVQSRPAPRSWSAATSDGLAAPPQRATMVGVFVMALVALVLVVACTNLANLVLARGASRHAEFAVRHALGGSRWRLIREVVIENAILTALGGLGAAAVTRILVTLFTTDVPISSGRVIRLEPVVSAPVLALAAASLLLSLIVFALIPAMHLIRRDLRPSLVTEGGSAVRRGWRGRRRLVSWQVAVSTAFFLVAAFCLQGVLAEARHDSGVDVDRLAIGGLNFYLAPWNEPRAREAVERVLETVRQLPDVEAATVASGMPFGTTITPFADLTAVGSPGNTTAAAMLLAVTPDFFRTSGIGVARGRVFDPRDAAGVPLVAVVSDATARALFGSGDPIGRQITLRGATTRDRNTYVHTIIGVADDTDVQFVFHRHMGSVYVPFAQRYEAGLMLIARTAGDPAALAPALSLAARRADPDLVLGDPTSGALTLTGLYVLIGMAGKIATGLALLSLVLAMTGLYGVLAQAVAGRTREIGVRLALGAERGRIRRMVLRDGLTPVAIGVGLGAGLGFVIRVAFTR